MQTLLQDLEKNYPYGWVIRDNTFIPYSDVIEPKIKIRLNNYKVTVRLINNIYYYNNTSPSKALEGALKQFNETAHSVYLSFLHNSIDHYLKNRLLNLVEN